MKKILFLIFSFLNFYGFSQVTFQGNLSSDGAPNSTISTIYLKHSGFKFVCRNNDSLVFYNLNLSLFKQFKIPYGWNVNKGYPCDISEGLFDTDTLHIDYMMITNGFNPDSIAIYKEDISTIYREDSVILPQMHVQTGGGILLPNITNTDSGTYMTLMKSTPSTTVASYYQVFKLGGSLPCIPECLGSSLLTDNSQTQLPRYSSSIYPNPATTYTDIYFELPQGLNSGQIIIDDLTGRELKRFNIDSRFDHLHLSTSDLAAGTYFYQVFAGQQILSNKKIVVIK